MQSPGAYALVNAMKNNTESKLIEVELTVRLRDTKKNFSKKINITPGLYKPTQLRRKVDCSLAMRSFPIRTFSL